MTKIKYVGTVEDRLGSLPAHHTREYATELEAYRAAERLDRKYFGTTNRGQIDIKQEGLEMKRSDEMERFEIDWWRTHEFGDADCVGRLKDGRWFWTWDIIGTAMDDEELLAMGAEDGEIGGVVTDTLEALLDEMEGREDLQELVKETFA